MPRRNLLAAIEDCAIRLFAERGVAATTIADIARAAGVSQGALYKHYSGKDAMAESLFMRHYLALGATMDTIQRDHGSFEDRIFNMVLAFCRLFDRDTPLFCFLLLSQHNYLREVQPDDVTPVSVLADVVRDAMREGVVAPPAAFRPVPGATTAEEQRIAIKTAAVMGVVLQAATFKVYGRLAGSMEDAFAEIHAAARAAARA